MSKKQSESRSESSQLLAMLRKHYEFLDSAGAIAIDPNHLATLVLQELDPGVIAPIMVRHAAHLELRQLGRQVCRSWENQPQPELDLGELQPRYPAMREGKEQYVRRECLTIQERDMWIKRLKSEAQAKLRHAELLEEETKQLQREGKFNPDGTRNDLETAVA